MENSRTEINYKLLRKINPETARTAVLEYLVSHQGNISKTAKAFGIQRVTVYDILKKQKTGDLKDRTKIPKRIANKTASNYQMMILYLKKETGWGAKKLSKYLTAHYQINIAVGTLRGILRKAGFNS